MRVRPFVFECGSADVVLRVFNTCVSGCYVSHLSFSRHVFVLFSLSHPPQTEPCIAQETHEAIDRETDYTDWILH